MVIQRLQIFITAFMVLYFGSASVQTYNDIAVEAISKTNFRSKFRDKNSLEFFQVFDRTKEELQMVNHKNTDKRRKFFDQSQTYDNIVVKKREAEDDESHYNQYYRAPEDDGMGFTEVQGATTVASYKDIEELLAIGRKYQDKQDKQPYWKSSELVMLNETLSPPPPPDFKQDDYVESEEYVGPVVVGDKPAVTVRDELFTETVAESENAENNTSTS